MFTSCPYPSIQGIAKYIRNQIEEDYAADQVTMKEYIDPFTGSKTKQAKINSRS